MIERDEEAHLHGPPRDGDGRDGDVHDWDVHKVCQSGGVAKEAADDEADQGYDEGTVLGRNDGGDEVTPAGGGIGCKDEGDDEPPIRNVGLSDQEVNGCEDERHQHDVHGVDENFGHIVGLHVDAAGALAPEDWLIVSEHTETEDGQEQGQAGVQVQVGHSVPGWRLRDVSIQDCQDDPAQGQRNNEDAALAVHSPPLHQSSQGQDLELFHETRTVGRHLLEGCRRIGRTDGTHALVGRVGCRIFIAAFLHGGQWLSGVGPGDTSCVGLPKLLVPGDVVAEAGEVVHELPLGHRLRVWSHPLHQLADDLVCRDHGGTMGQQFLKLLRIHDAILVGVDGVPTFLEILPQNGLVFLGAKLAALGGASKQAVVGATGGGGLQVLVLVAATPHLEEHVWFEVADAVVGDFPTQNIHEPIGRVLILGHFESEALEVGLRVQRRT
mmetsp:Transcript_36783/g.79723  ORF Transcript_36783/g.79723 Transcript_36783/m.79723 type:complete len:439 (+) Transcript_36783:313-1629(+)